MEYLHKYTENPYPDLLWNIPERKQGLVNILGGNSQNFRTPVKVTEYLANNFPIETVNLVLPDSLKSSLPPLPNLLFLSSTDSGSFSNADELKDTLNSADFNLIIGDLSKNNITKEAIRSACCLSEKPTIITRDAVDLITESVSEQFLMNDNIILFASLIQFQKLFKAVYYPKILTLSQSFVQITEAFHKFTLSYPVSIITLSNDQIVIAKNGNIHAIPLEKTTYSPLTLWLGESAAKILAFNLFNPNNFEKATTASLF